MISKWDLRTEQWYYLHTKRTLEELLTFINILQLKRIMGVSKCLSKLVQTHVFCEQHLLHALFYIYPNEL